MQHGVVSHEDSEVIGLVGCLEAEALAVMRHRRTNVADRKRGNGSVEACGSPTVMSGHAAKNRESSGC